MRQNGGQNHVTCLTATATRERLFPYFNRLQFRLIIPKLGLVLLATAMIPAGSANGAT